MNRKTLWKTLLDQARHLATKDSHRPGQANLRRAASAAYYALFHFLIDEATKHLMGPEAGAHLYRAVLGRGYDHAIMAKTCKSFGGGTLPGRVSAGLPATFAIPVEMRDLATAFLVAQEKRHKADYDLSSTFAKVDVLDRIADVENVIEGWRSIAAEPGTRFFLASLLVWERIGSRH